MMPNYGICYQACTMARLSGCAGAGTIYTSDTSHTFCLDKENKEELQKVASRRACLAACSRTACTTVAYFPIEGECERKIALKKKYCSV